MNQATRETIERASEAFCKQHNVTSPFQAIQNQQSSILEWCKMLENCKPQHRSGTDNRKRPRSRQVGREYLR